MKLNYQYFTAAMGQIGVLCTSTKKYVYRCGPNTQFKVDEASKPYCDITCSSDGQRFANPTKLTSYNVCTLNSAATAYIKVPFNCPKNFVFDAKKNECVSDTVPNDKFKKILDKYDVETCDKDGNKIKCTA